MKTGLSFLLILLSFVVSSQNIVNIKLTRQAAPTCQVVLYPTAFETSILSNVVFTLKWRRNSNVAVGDPAGLSFIGVFRSGSVWTNGDWKYQVYTGVGMVTTNIGQPIVINIPKTGFGAVTIANDNFSNTLPVNGKYYVSIGGDDVTGSILTNLLTNEQINNHKSIEDVDEVNSYKMYYDPFTSQILFMVDGVYRNALNQLVIVNDQTQLRLIRKQE